MDNPTVTAARAADDGEQANARHAEIITNRRQNIPHLRCRVRVRGAPEEPRLQLTAQEWDERRPTIGLYG